MKNLKLLTVSFIFLILLTNLSCRKEKDNKDALPPETHNGLNTFGCLVNNELFRESGSLSFGLSNPNAEIRDSVLSIDASQAVPNGQQIISFGIKKFKGIGKYYTGAGFVLKKYSTDGNVDSYCEYRTDSVDNTGYVDITYYDPIKKIVSGNFSFNTKFYYSSLKPSPCNSSDYSITDGRFDLTFYKWN